MRLGAIVILGDEAASAKDTADLLAEPLVCVETAGRSVLDRTLQCFLDAGVEFIRVLASPQAYDRMPALPAELVTATVQMANDVGLSIAETLAEFSQAGVDYSFINRAESYTETDLLDLFYFHREAKSSVTRAFDAEGLLDLWVVDCALAQAPNIGALLEESGRDGSSYFIREYSCRVAHARDLRKLATDTLQRRCAFLPNGEEIRPGVWAGEGAVIDPLARIVAPAYIGCGSRVLEDTLITRCSSIERDCFVDFGTVIENSSILANSHIGIWLDVCHAVVRANRMLSVGRDVTVEISDPSILRSSLLGRRREFHLDNHFESRPLSAGYHKQLRPPENWQAGAILSRE